MSKLTETARRFHALQSIMSAATMAQQLADPVSRWDDNEERERLEMIEADLMVALKYVNERLDELTDDKV